MPPGPTLDVQTERNRPKPDETGSSRAAGLGVRPVLWRFSPPSTLAPGHSAPSRTIRRNATEPENLAKITCLKIKKLFNKRHQPFLSVFIRFLAFFKLQRPTRPGSPQPSAQLKQKKFSMRVLASLSEFTQVSPSIPTETECVAPTGSRLYRRLATGLNRAKPDERDKGAARQSTARRFPLFSNSALRSLHSAPVQTSSVPRSHAKRNTQQFLDVKEQLAPYRFVVRVQKIATRPENIPGSPPATNYSPRDERRKPPTPALLYQQIPKRKSISPTSEIFLRKSISDPRSANSNGV